jgi:cytochrome c
MGGMEGNKIFAAFLVAGIVASLSGFIAHKVSHPHDLEEFAYNIESLDGGAASSVKKESLPEPIMAMIAEADIARGQKLSKACAACHSFEKGGPDGTGPNLYNILNRKKGSVSGFSYSDAMSSSQGSWGYAELNKFLWKPKWYISGTKMNYIGMKKPEDRAAMIAWLRTLSDSPASMPGASDIAAEAAELTPAGE